VVFDRLEVVIELARVLVASLAGRIIFFGDIGFYKSATSDKFEGLVFEIALGRLNIHEIGFLVVSLLGSVVGFYVEESYSDLVLIGSVSLGARFEEVVEFIKLLGALF
jgi:hypothetical protein